MGAPQHLRGLERPAGAAGVGCPEGDERKGQWMKERIFADFPDRTTRVQRLVKLPFGKSVDIAYKSIKVRFFRSLITTLSLVLAVSFLSYTDISNDIANGMLAGRNPEMRQALTEPNCSTSCAEPSSGVADERADRLAQDHERRPSRGAP